MLWLSATSVYGNYLTPKIAVSHIMIASLNLEGVTVHVSFMVANINDSDLNVEGIEYYVSIAGQAPLTGKIVQSEVFPAKKVRLVTVPVTLSYSEDIAHLLKSLQKPGVKSYEIKGTIFMKNEPVIPYYHRGEIKLPGIAP